MKTKIDPDDFRVYPGKTVRLKKWPTRVKPFFHSKAEYRKMLTDHVERLCELQELLYAYNRYSILVIFQAMDAAGKDSAIKHVMSGLNPQGCQVFSFKHPSAEELDHDFLWRTNQCLPERGRIGIFNRSYYEEVLIVRVHPEILEAEALPPSSGKDIWSERYRSMNDLERHLHRNGTHVIKFFLHLSPEEQRKRFLARIEEPGKNWKFSLADMAERKLWKEYMKAYEACLGATSTAIAPWYVIPADHKENTRLIVSSILVKTISRLKMSYPQPSKAQRKELESIRKLLAR